MFKKILLITVILAMTSALVWAEGKYSIKTMTPEVHKAFEARKGRFAELKSLKAEGSLGENNRGYVEVLKNDGKAQSVAAEENGDREIIYKTIAQQNGLEGALSTIESAFAQVRRDKADSGDKIQTEDGRWITK